VNYYERHIGDYLKDTAHLSLLEHGIYTRLLDVYYTRECPIPKAEVSRLIGARTKDERTALDSVLLEFFREAGDTYVQDRCDREIRKFADKSGKAKRSAEARWNAQRSHSDGNADASANAMRTHSEGNALQSPDTSNQTQIKKGAKAPSSPGKLPTCPHQAIVDLYHEVLPELPGCRLLPDGRKRAIGKTWAWVLTSKKPDHTPRATTAEEALAWFRKYFELARDNDFLMGRTPRTGDHASWKCDLDFLLTDRGMKHVIEKTEPKDPT
jgi:uncharacterized protein YdaU (DUF1376 family)